MTEKLLAVEVPEGMRLGFSQDTDGARRGLLFDEKTNKLVRHAELYEVDDDRDRSLSLDAIPPKGGRDADDVLQTINQLLTLVELVIEIAPHAQRLWREVGSPAYIRARAWAREKRGLKRTEKSEPQAVDSIIVDGADSQSIAPPVVAQLATQPEDTPSMSNAETRQRLADALEALAHAQDQLRDLHDAVIGDPSGATDLAATLDALTPEAIDQAIDTLLASSASHS